MKVALTQVGYTCRPAKEKAIKCLKVMQKALADNYLSVGCAEKLAGRLNWAGQYLFRRIGRAMLRPIFEQKFNRSGKLSAALRIALGWWCWVLQQDIVEERRWQESDTPPVHLFVDARGEPPHCAAILFMDDGEVLYTDGKPAAHFLECFQRRADQQIMALEIMAIAVGLSTFSEQVRGRKVIVFSDNKGAEVPILCERFAWLASVKLACVQEATRKGSAKSWDHAQLIHEIWSHALCNGTALWLERVDSESNLSDLPSRMEYDFVCELDAVWHEPKIAKIYHDPAALNVYWSE